MPTLVSLNMAVENHLGYKLSLQMPWPLTRSVSLFEKAESDYITQNLHFRFLFILEEQLSVCARDYIRIHNRLLRVHIVVRIRNSYICVWVSHAEFYTCAYNTKSSHLIKLQR